MFALASLDPQTVVVFTTTACVILWGIVLPIVCFKEADDA